jgi:hypothetical protein
MKKINLANILVILFLLSILISGCQGGKTALPPGSKLADDIAFGRYKNYSNIEKIQLYFYNGKKVKYLEELEGKNKSEITNQKDIVNFAKNLEDYDGKIDKDEKSLSHGLCLIKLKKDFVYFYFELYEKSVYIQPPSFKDEFGGHGSANKKIHGTLHKLYESFQSISSNE